MGIYKFLKSGIASVGVGTRDLGLEQQLNLIPASIYGPRYNVQKSMARVAPAYAKIGRDIVPVSILGNTGVGYAPAIKLSPLASDNGGK